MLLVMNNQAQRLGVSRCELVHDEQSEFQEQFEHVFGLLTGASAGDVTDVSGTDYGLPVQHLRRLRFGASVDSRSLQIADCVARVAGHVLEYEQTEVSSDLADPLKSLTQPHRESMYVVGSLGWRPIALSRLIGDTNSQVAGTATRADSSPEVPHPDW